MKGKHIESDQCVPVLLNTVILELRTARLVGHKVKSPPSLPDTFRQQDDDSGGYGNRLADSTS